MKTSVLNYAVLACATIFLTSCGSPGPESVIRECEKCLGENKTIHELKGLSKKEASELAVCLMGPMEGMRKAVGEMEVNDAVEYTNKVKAAMEQSEYKEILHRLDYKALKEMELAYTYESKTLDELAKMYCEWAAKEAAAKDSDNKLAREEADMYQDAIRDVVRERNRSDDEVFDELTKDCKDH